MELIDAISQWIKDQVVQAGAQGVVVGLSGGIDSAVVAALAKKSLHDQVLGLILPCHSASKDAADARLIARHLQLNTKTYDLSPVYDAMIAMLPLADINIVSNLKPRLRMTVLYYHASLNNYLVAGTGNKSELLVGYFTKHGDGGSDMLPLGDLFKSQVNEIAHALALPKKIITKPPSAGLKVGQTDEEELKITYRQLDHALSSLTGEKGQHIPAEIRSRVETFMKHSEHKRNPIPVFKLNNY